MPKRIAAVMAWCRLRTRTSVGSAVELCGCAAIAWGAYLAWEPAGWLVAGGLAVLLAQGIGGD